MQKTEDEIREELLEAIEETANLMRGICFDPLVPKNIKEVLIDKIQTLDTVVDEYA
jgi:uncharacterized protein (UPF0147 family)